MNKRIRITFLFLILNQGIHSVEEYITGLWEVFTPARIVSNIFSSDTEKGFIIINIFLFIAGIICWILISTRNGKKFLPFVWFFVIIGFINGIGHPLWGIFTLQYVPGLVTSVVILGLDIYLTFQLKDLSPMSSQ